MKRQGGLYPALRRSSTIASSVCTGIVSQAPPLRASSSRSTTRGARQLGQHPSQHHSTATCIWLVFFFFSQHCCDTIYPIDFSLFFYLQGIKQHSPAAYVLNKTGPKHRLPLAAGTMSATKLDSLNPNTEAVTVRFSLYSCLCQVMLCLSERI